MMEHLGTAQGIVTASVCLGSILFAVAVHRHQRKQLKERDERDSRRVTPTFEEGAMRANIKKPTTSEQRFADAREERMAREAVARQQKFGVENDVRQARKNAGNTSNNDRRSTDDTLPLTHPLHPLNPVTSPVYDSTPARSSDSDVGRCGNGWGGVETGSSSGPSASCDSPSPTSD